jgi:O-antigen chain-terminating methyltransferase
LHVDAIAHLIQLNDASLDGAFIAHVVEHVSHEYLIKLLKLLGQKLQPGAPLVIVTPNILNISVSTVSFYMDPTHRTHIHPDYLEFVLKSNSFKIVEKKWYQPTIPASIKLEKIDVEELPDNEKLMAKRLNSNIDKLNELLFGNRDFAIVAKRLA